MTFRGVASGGRGRQPWGPAASTGRFRLALTEAIRAAEDQAADIGKIRDRCIQLVGLGGATAALLGGVTATDGKAWGGWAWLAVALFVVAVAIATWVMWPKRLPVPPYPSHIILWAEQGATPDDMDRDLALYLEDSYERAAQTHKWMVRAYCGTIALIGLMIVALLINLRSH